MTAGSPSQRRRVAILAGHRAELGAARQLLGDEDPAVRAAALGALARAGGLTAEELQGACLDPSPLVRRRAAQEAGSGTVGAAAPGGPRSAARALPELPELLDDEDPMVVEMAAWALGERGDRASVGRLSIITMGHDDPLCREAAVAALGAIGDQAGLAAILAATSD
ncbi:MAG TPA: HEAT repeat domain-containing protein, partial [Acidimicrobiales bacterium]